jgi:hypothetical protein
MVVKSCNKTAFLKPTSLILFAISSVPLFLHAEASDEKVYLNFQKSGSYESGAPEARASNANRENGGFESVQFSFGPPPTTFGENANQSILPTFSYKGQILNLGEAKDSQLNRVGLGFFYRYALKDNSWFAIIGGETWRAESGTKFSWHEQVSPLGIFLYSIPYGNEWKLTVGVGGAKNYKGVVFFPALAVKYRSTDKHHSLDLGYLSASYFYRSWGNIQTGLVIDGSDEVYLLSSSYQTTENQQEKYIRPVVYSAGPAIRYRAGIVSYNVTSGVIRQRLIGYDSNFSEVNSAAGYTSSWFAKVGISLQFAD